MGAGASPIQPLTIGASSGSNLNYYSGTSNVISSSSGIKVSKAIANDAGAGSGLNLSNTSSTNGTMSPMLHFSALSASTTYSTTYAGIWGRKLSNGTDTNWNVGSIEFGTSHSAGINKRMELNYLGGLITTPLGGGHAVFNEDSQDVDFRVESNGNANMLFVDGGNNVVNINATQTVAQFGMSKPSNGVVANWAEALAVCNFSQSADANTGSRTRQILIPMIGLETVKVTLINSGHVYNNGGAYYSRETQFDLMIESSTQRINNKTNVNLLGNNQSQIGEPTAAVHASGVMKITYTVGATYTNYTYLKVEGTGVASTSPSISTL
jgi:prepilin-type processing-associated H-X9-DG protein